MRSAMLVQNREVEIMQNIIDKVAGTKAEQ